MTAREAKGTLRLVRHTLVSPAWSARCYGASNVPLGREGRAAARKLAHELADWRPDIIFASPLRRAWWLAARVARLANAPLRIDARLAERDFGTWEGRSWDDIYAETGDAMMGMLTAPHAFRPGGGETTAELCARALAWQSELPTGANVLAVAHGGPIAAMVATAEGLSPKDWSRVIPPPGSSTFLPSRGQTSAHRSASRH